ncbi:lymphocyte cytosolic protein 2 [Talpa occidentalis]|uniref:lymphocyte cytosolic protein 2 n=1 Tax=Talpa occidentalis TaxID=50954 RepID=UPI00188ED7FC|nr:lymphocyte cytosolic protein 2 [Talpa occidentalis]XP_054547005.1 lymphocyte cytosolic protein 2 [Talpa occidentalis]XP_054547006.1 lymphocyte cytosolic protein 2 [Talpa occidentalis]
MALRNVPFRSEVLTWDTDNLADYFRKLNYKDCEKAVKKHHIDGPRFLNLTENDIQKFPKLRMPLLSKLSQDINKNEERRSIFARKPQVQRFPEDRESHEEDNGGWSSFEEDDYESPNEDQEEGDGDYESPNEDEVVPPVEDDADYEPPPSNDEEALQNSILPAKPFPNSMYIDRPHSGKSQQQPPVPPQRPIPGLPPPTAARNHLPPPPLQSNHEEPSRSRNQKPAKIPAPSIDRSTKPPLDRSLAPFDREPFAPVKRPPFSDKPSTPAGRPLGEHLPKIQKPPLPPTTERHERSTLPGIGKKQPMPRPGWGPDRRENDEDDVHQRPLPPPALPSVSSNTFSSRPTKQTSKYSLPAPHVPGGFSDSNSGFLQSASLPPYFPQGSSSRMQPRVDNRNFSLPVPGKHRPPSPEEEENPLNEEWYVSYITRPEAEAALRKINQDGTFLVRDSSKKTITNPYVLMVLYKDKVYNIQIRYQEESQVYLLGTGLRGKEDFLSVSDIIDYFKKMPLLLIDGKNRGSRYQCTLTYSAGCP